MDAKQIGQNLAEMVLTGKSKKQISALSPDEMYAILVPIVSEIEDTAMNVIMEKKVEARESATIPVEAEEPWWDEERIE